MKTFFIRYEDRNVEIEGKYGVSRSDRRALQPKLEKAKKAVLALSEKGEQGFLRLPSEGKHLVSCQRVLKALPRGCTDLIVLGIGGSDLGGRMLIDAIGSKNGMRVHFGGSTTDPDSVAELFDGMDPKKTCINLVSKSGGTIEPMASFLIAKELLRKGLPKKSVASRIVATTDAASGALHDLAVKDGYHTLEVPSNVGGRFSVLSSVGLFPALANGCDVKSLLSGGRKMSKKFLASSTEDCIVSSYAANHYLALSKGASVHVLMPYVAKLKSFGQWYRQLFAESLGKKLDRKGWDVYRGLTPVAALGPEDQHSQLQLYGEGPFDKIVTFLEADAFGASLKTPEIPEAEEPIRGYGGKRLVDIVHAERAASAESLKRQGRMNETIFIDRLDAESLGGLIVYFESAVAMLGELTDVNAFDQPGVELSKTLMKQMFRSH